MLILVNLKTGQAKVPYSNRPARTSCRKNVQAHQCGIKMSHQLDTFKKQLSTVFSLKAERLCGDRRGLPA
ncbi:unnamed protein product [Caretta caretta]